MDKHSIVYDLQSSEEFKDDWRIMIDMYRLHENDGYRDCTRIKDVGFLAS